MEILIIKTRLLRNDNAKFFLLIAGTMLLAFPTPAYAHDMSFPFYIFPWTLMVVWQVFLFRRMNRQVLEGSRIWASTLYAIALGILWWAIVFGLQERPVSQLDRELEKFGVTPTIEERQSHQLQTFEKFYGSELAPFLHNFFIYGAPVVIPLLLAWGLSRFGSKQRDKNSPGTAT